MASAFGYEPFEHFSKVQGDLFESELNGFEPFVIETLNQIDDVLETSNDPFSRFIR